jgi:hypothetical protein
MAALYADPPNFNVLFNMKTSGQCQSIPNCPIHTGARKKQRRQVQFLNRAHPLGRRAYIQTQSRAKQRTTYIYDISSRTIIMLSFNNALLGALLLAFPSTSLPLTSLPNSNPPDIDIVLQNISYASSTRFWGPGSVRTGIATLDFTIANTQTSNVHCTAHDTEGGYMDSYFRWAVPMTYYCDTTSGKNGAPANFTFSRFRNDIMINQTWNGPPIG